MNSSGWCCFDLARHHLLPGVHRRRQSAEPRRLWLLMTRLLPRAGRPNELAINDICNTGEYRAVREGSGSRRQRSIECGPTGEPVRRSW
jgi:hypothetical protein